MGRLPFGVKAYSLLHTLDTYFQRPKALNLKTVKL